MAADLSHLGGSEEESAEIRSLKAEVDADSDNFDTWQKLVEACAALEGGLNRNSSPQALAAFRDSYDKFLLKFPLVFGYWKKYARLEFSIAGPESAEMVYERGCASITNSVDLWTDYCSFKMETTHQPHLVRELFERAATHVGLDFLAHPFWDKYIEYEERQEAHDRITAIMMRAIHIPMHQYARYYEKFRQLTLSRPLVELGPSETISRIRTEIEGDVPPFAAPKRPELELEREIRTKLDAMYYEVFVRTQTETNKRWIYESEISRPYFHIAELEHSQLNNWRKYLDFEEAEGSYTRIVFLYERCLVTCAFYEEIWLRYARWMAAQDGKTEEVRNIYQRAATLFIPVSRPGLRLQYAHFEESCDRPDVARDIHYAILMKIPDCIEAIVSLAHLQRRENGLDGAIQVLKEQIDSTSVDLYTKAALVTEWAFLLYKVKGSVDEARTAFQNNVQWYADSLVFWEKWLQFELEQPTNTALEPDHAKRIANIFDELRVKSRLSVTVKKSLLRIHLRYLHYRGGKEAMKQFLVIDRDTYGPSSVSIFTKPKSEVGKSGGLMPGVLDEATRAKAEARYINYFELFASQSDAQGTAPYG